MMQEELEGSSFGCCFYCVTELRYGVMTHCVLHLCHGDQNNLSVLKLFGCRTNDLVVQHVHIKIRPKHRKSKYLIS